MLTGGDTIVTRIVAAMDESAFYVDSNRHIFRAALDLYMTDMLVSPESVAAALDGDAGKLRSWCGQANGRHPAYERAEATVLDCWRRRRFAGICSESKTRAMDREIDLGSVLSEMGSFLDSPELTIDNAQPSPTLEQLLAQPVVQRWLVPDFLERRDRMIVTGAEGGGKSTLLRQWAVQLALGIDPMRLGLFSTEGVRVMYLECENGARMTFDSFRSMLASVNAPIPDNLHVEIRPQGLDLLSAADQRWILARVAATRPDVIIGGPLYKMFEAPPEDETAAKHTQRFFDRIRVRYDCALILEAHSPHGVPGDKYRPLRPIGSSVWLRWPEFGYGLRQTKQEGRWNWEEWRGPRDRRDFPASFDRGDTGNWAWEPVHTGRKS